MTNHDRPHVSDIADLLDPDQVALALEIVDDRLIEDRRDGKVMAIWEDYAEMFIAAYRGDV